MASTEKTTKTFRSKILEYFPAELLAKIEVVTGSYNLDNNTKAATMKKLMTEYGVDWTSLGTGTNRVGVKINGYVFKLALDYMGQTDNKREFKYSPLLQPFVVEVYECLPNGLISVCEYVTPFSSDDYYERMEEVRDILKQIGDKYLLGDIGLTTNNYGNWGILNPQGIVKCLDFAYIYSFGYQVFTCSCGSILEYDNDFVNLICPNCRKKYSFTDVRKRITRADEAAEIGDMHDYSYTVHGATEELPIDPRFTEIKEKKKKKNKNKRTNEPSIKEGYTTSNLTKEEIQMSKKITTSNERYAEMLRRGGYKKKEEVEDFDGKFFDGIRLFSGDAPEKEDPKVEETKPDDITIETEVTEPEKTIPMDEYFKRIQKRIDNEYIHANRIKIEFNEEKDYVSISDGYRSFTVNTNAHLHTSTDQELEYEAHISLMLAVIRHITTFMAPSYVTKKEEFMTTSRREGLVSYNPNEFIVCTAHINDADYVLVYIFDGNIEGVAERLTQYGLRTKTFYSLINTLIKVVTSPMSSFWSGIIMHNELPDKVFNTKMSAFSELTGHEANFELPEDNQSLSTIDDISYFRFDNELMSMIKNLADDIADDDDDEYDDDDCCDDEDCNDDDCDCCDEDDDYDDPDTINLVGLDEYRGRD